MIHKLQTAEVLRLFILFVEQGLGTVEGETNLKPMLQHVTKGLDASNDAAQVLVGLDREDLSAVVRMNET